MQYRRAKTPGGTFFFTVVTHRRRKFLCVPENIILLRQAFWEMGTGGQQRIGEWNEFNNELGNGTILGKDEG